MHVPLRNWWFGAALACSMQAFGVGLSDEIAQEHMLEVCFTVTVIAIPILEGDDDIIRKVSDNFEPLLIKLSNPLPQTYNAAKAGLTEALAQQGTANPDHPANASSELRAAVLGLWCINDTINGSREGMDATLQNAETQQQLIDHFLEAAHQP